MAHSAIAGQRITIRNGLDLSHLRRPVPTLEIQRPTPLIERAIIDAGFQISHDGRLKRRARDSLVTQDSPRAGKRVRVGLSVEPLGTEIVGGDGAGVGAVRGDGSQEINGALVGVVVAAEIGERGTLRARERNTGAVGEKGAVLDAPFERVGVGR